MSKTEPTIPTRFQRWWPWCAAILSGVLLTCCFAPPDIGGLAFIALIPLMATVWLSKSSRRPRLYHFGLGYVSGLVFYTSSFYWLSELSPLFDAVALKGLPLLLGAYLALFPATWALLAGWIAGEHFRVAPHDPLSPFERPPLLLSVRNLALSIFVAAAWTSLEWIRGWFISGFGWNSLGVALHSELALIQIAEFTGVGGITFLLVMCNAMALITVLRVRAEIGRIRLRPHFDFAATVALVVLVFGFGVRVLSHSIDQPLPSTTIRVACVQPNIPQPWKFSIPHWPKIFDRMQALSDLAALTKPDLLLWPEAAVPGGVLADVDTIAYMRDRAATVPALIVGTDDLDRDAPGEDHNSAALFLAGKKEPEFYDKRQLVPFGEYLPFRPILGFALGGLVPGDFKPGTAPGVFTLTHPPLKVAPLICFEDTRGDITRQSVQLGAQLLVNLTNDGWFGRTAELEQHFADSIFRAIENRRPLVRCTNNGVTASVDSYGRVDRWGLEKFTEGHATREIAVPTNPPVTFYTRFGEVFAIACTALVVLVIVLRRVVRRSAP